MSALPAIRAASGGMTRRRVQTVVIFGVLLVSTAAATLGLALLVATSGPFQHAFAARHGADVALATDSTRATQAQLASTGKLPGVTRVAGPFPEASVALQVAGAPVAAATVGRASPAGSVDELTLAAGRWARRPGEIVLSSSLGASPPLGSKVVATGAPGRPRLTVVGYATSVTGTADAWVVPAEVGALRPPGEPAAAQLLYRFAGAGTDTQIRADVKKVSAALPAGAVTGFASWLTAQAQATGRSAVIAPFVVAFAVMGLAMAVLIVANVVSGAVIASYRRIGVLKSLGFTPAQVIGAYTFRVGVPTLAGCAVGVVLGNLLAVPVLRKSATAFGAGTQLVPPWVDAAALLLMCALVGLAAGLPALRAGRLSAIQAIATGHAPRQGHGYLAQRLAGRVRLPRPLTIGLAAPFARPARTVVVLTAIAVGTTAVIFAVGLDSSLVKVTQGRQATVGGQVQVATANGAPLPSGDGQAQKIVAALRALPGTLRYAAVASPPIGVSGLTQQVNAQAFDGGDTAWLRQDMVSGRWFAGPGEADVNTAFLTQTGLSVGGTAVVTTGGRSVRVKIVGQVFDPGQSTLITNWRTLGGAAAGLTATQYDVQLRPGVDPQDYSGSLGRALGPKLAAYVTSQGGGFERTSVSLIGLLTLMIIVVSGLGVLNTILLGVRERIHDLGVFKAVGMTPRQLTTMVICWMIAPAVAAAVIAIPVGVALHYAVVKAMARAAGTGIPPGIMHVYAVAELAALALAALIIAAAGGLMPARWVARSTTVAALRTE